MKRKRTFVPAGGLDNKDNLRLLRGDLDRLLADYANGDFALTVGNIRYAHEGKNAVIKLKIALKENGVTITHEVTGFERHAERLGVGAPLGAMVNVKNVGEGMFVGYNQRATRYPFLFKVTNPNGCRTVAGATYKLTIAQAKDHYGWARVQEGEGT